MKCRTQRITAIVSSVVLTASMLYITPGCKRGGMTIVTDAWNNPPPTNDELLDWKDYPLDTLIEVPPTCREESVRLLSKDSVVQLTNDDLKRLGINTAQSQVKGVKPYLLRGLKFGGSGRYALQYHEKAIWVSAGILTRSSPPPVEKIPFVVSLPFMPSTLYVSVEAAE